MRHVLRTFRSAGWIAGTAFAFACAGGGGEQRYLDRSFASLCEAFETAGRFALTLHVEKTEADFPAVRAAAAEKLAADWEVNPPSASTEGCGDLETIAEAHRGKTDEADLTEQVLYQSALAAFVSLLDPHSSYLPPEAEKRFRQEQKNEGFGIGIVPRTKVIDRWEPIAALVVDQVFANSPAAGILSAGDRILSVEGTPVSGKLFREAWSLIAGGEGEEVTLGLDGREDPVTLRRASYYASPLRAQILTVDSRSIGYLKIREFTDRTAEIFATARRKMETDHGASGLILDLRGCPGGLAKEAAKLIGSFVERGTVYSTAGKEIRNPSELNPNGTSGELETSGVSRLPLVVLTDPGTASAAEIVAGTLRESSRALVVGERSFGKGTGQIPVPLAERNGLGGEILLTMFRYYLFDGFSPQVRGIEPHIRIPDPALERIVAQGKNRTGPVLYEEDYGHRIVSAVGGGSPSAPQEPLANVIDELERHRKDGDYADVCAPSTDDCLKELALRLLADMIDVRPEWPPTELKGPVASLKIRALDRTGEATYPSRHDGEKTSRLAKPPKAPLLQR